MNAQSNLKWYQKPLTVILFLIFFFPIGLILMWKHSVWTQTARWIITAVIALLIIVNIGSPDLPESADISDSTDNVGTIEGTKKCLIGYDWVYPSINNATGAWKFSSDGTFNSSTTMFGGTSSWGYWTVDQPRQIRVSYTRTSTGEIPNDQTLRLQSCDELQVGSTQYSKH